MTGQVLTEGQRFYRTGDLGYFDEEGLLYFCGRKDFQIKHMGHRIELEEIEQAMDMVPNLKRSCCLMDTAHNRIVAFYLGNVKSAEIRRALKEHVPDYMVPRKFIQAETFPLNKMERLTVLILRAYWNRHNEKDRRQETCKKKIFLT